ncbi:MAG: inositol monophosphatase family protein [Bdellovibrionia bacterium]
MNKTLVKKKEPVTTSQKTSGKFIEKSPGLYVIRDQAIRAAHAAGEVLLKHYGKRLRISEKKGAGLVTQADLEAQDRCVSILKKGFPDFGFLTEEAPPEVGRSPGRWIIDPLDGTNNFIHGFPMFCVSIAAEWEGKLVAGVIYHPLFKDTYVAVAGKGATVNGKRIQVSKTRRIQDSLLTTGFTYKKDRFLTSEMKTFEYLSSLARAVRRPGSAAMDLAYTARGVFDAFWERRLSAWDIAAGALLVEEAGGKVSDFAGNALSLDAGQLLATNGTLHPLLLKNMSRF